MHGKDASQENRPALPRPAPPHRTPGSAATTAPETVNPGTPFRAFDPDRLFLPPVGAPTIWRTDARADPAAVPAQDSPPRVRFYPAVGRLQGISHRPRPQAGFTGSTDRPHFGPICLPAGRRTWHERPTHPAGARATRSDPLPAHLASPTLHAAAGNGPDTRRTCRTRNRTTAGNRSPWPGRAGEDGVEFPSNAASTLPPDERGIISGTRCRSNPGPTIRTRSKSSRPSGKVDTASVAGPARRPSWPGAPSPASWQRQPDPGGQGKGEHPAEPRVALSPGGGARGVRKRSGSTRRASRGYSDQFVSAPPTETNSLSPLATRPTRR